MAFLLKKSSAALALVLSASVYTQSVTAEDVVPVIELGVGARSQQPPPTQVNVASSPTTVSGNSELILIVQQLQDEVRSLRGQLEQQNYRLKQMEQQQLDRYRDLDRRITAAASAPASTANVAAAPNPSAATTATAPQVPTQPPTAATQPVAAVSDAQAYREAFGLVRERNFPKAASAFTSFITQYPQSARLANAYYWLGEIHLAEQKPDLAREPFLQVITKFAEHRKAPDAAYKLGIVYDQLGDADKSAQYLDLVINKYPDSSAVRLAEEFKRRQ